MNELKKCFFALAFILLAGSCQKDDICPPGTATTPLLVIDFTDSGEIERLKAVSNLSVRAAEKEEFFLQPTTTNNVSIPLRTDENFTEYIFTQNSGREDENQDVVTFSYTPTLEYINRACGYKINYVNLVVTVHNDEDNWINAAFILQENVENDTEAHLFFTH